MADAYRVLFDKAPLAMCILDASGLKEYLDRLRSAGVVDLIDHFALNPESLAECVTLVRVLDANAYALELSGAADSKEFGERITELLCEETYPLLIKQLIAMTEGREDQRGETVIRDLSGEKVNLFMNWTVMPDIPAYSRIVLSAADVTGRVAVEEKLKAAVAEWRDTFDATQDLMFILDPDYRVIRANEAASRFLGMPEKEITGRHCYELMHGSEEPVEGCPLAMLDNTGEHADAELFIENHGIWAQISVDPILGRDGGIIKVVHVFKDITERKLTEEKLRESERLYRMLADNTRDLICMCDNDLIRRYVSPSYKTVLGYEPEELTGVSIFSQVPPGEEEKKRKEFVESFKGGSTDIVRQQLLHREGRAVWIDTRASQLHGSGGEVIGFLIVSRDVTNKVEAEEKLRESERLYRMLTENSQELICMSDLEGRRTYVSPSYRAMLGYEPEELLGSYILDIIHPDDYEAASGELNKGLGEKEPGSYVHRIRLKDGSYIWVESHGSLIRDEEGKAVGGLVASWNVTKKVEAEERLRESERLYRMLADNTQDLLCMCDRDFVRVYVSPSYRGVLGYEPEELLGESVFSQLPEEEAKAAREEFLRIADGWSPGTVRRHVRCKDGHYITVDSSNMVIRDDEGELVGWLLTSRDVSSQAEAEEKLRESERLYRMLADNTQDLLTVCDLAGKRIYVSPSHKTVLGFEAEELLGNNLIALVHPDDVDRVAEDLSRGMGEKLPGSSIHRMRRKDGGYIWIEAHGTPLFDEQGEMIGGLAVSWNIDDKIESEERLKESERLYRMLADNTQDVISLCDPQGINTYVSPSVRKVLGYEPEELVGKPILFLAHSDDLFEASRAYRHNMEAGTPSILRVRNRRKDGSYVWLESQGTPLFDESGTITGALTVSRDVTEQVRAEDMLRKHNEELKDFLAVAAHELRHPICLVQGYANTLADFRNEMDQQTMDEVYGSITAASRRLTSLVEELLEVSRIERDRFSIERATVNPAYSLRKVVEEMRERGMTNPVLLDTEGAAETWSLDPEKFHQLLVILLDNAAKYSPANSPIEAELTSGPDGLSLAVSDLGCGISDMHREKVFQRFFQVEDSGHHSVPGLGLGLYIAREIVEGHGGSIHHKNREGVGSVFRFIIP